MPTPLPTAAREPIAALAECHQRIRTYCEGLRRVVALSAEADPRIPPAAAQAARYLREGLPLHAADEDDSLAPRLRRAQPETAALLDTLAREHTTLEERIARLLPSLDTLAAGGAVDPSTLAAAVTGFVEPMEAHLHLEEAELFPALERLDRVELLAAGAEMVARRRG